MTTEDRIEKEIVMRAPRARVWQALTEPVEFGTWFGARMETPFVVGRVARGRITSPGYEGLEIEMHVESMDAPERFAFRWHPHAVEPGVDYSGEPMTLVEFTLEEAGGGTRLVVVESGFSKLPPQRRDLAFRMNSDGWAQELRNVAAYVDA